MDWADSHRIKITEDLRKHYCKSAGNTSLVQIGALRSKKSDMWCPHIWKLLKIEQTTRFKGQYASPQFSCHVICQISELLDQFHNSTKTLDCIWPVVSTLYEDGLQPISPIFCKSHKYYLVRSMALCMRTTGTFVVSVDLYIPRSA